MSEENVNDPFSVVATKAAILPARRGPLKIVGESAAVIGLPGSPRMFMVRKDSGHLNEVRAVGRDTCPVVRVDRSRARRCTEEPGLVHGRPRIGQRLLSCRCHLAINDRSMSACAGAHTGGLSLAVSMLAVDGNPGLKQDEG